MYDLTKARLEKCGKPLKIYGPLVNWKRLAILEVIPLSMVKLVDMIQAIGEMGNPQAYKPKHRFGKVHG